MPTADRGHRTDDGHWEWTIETESGPLTIKHQFPDALTHWYTPGGINQAIPLFNGDFNIESTRAQPSYTGAISLAWRPQPRIELHGQRPERPGIDVAELFSSLEPDTDIWHPWPTVQIVSEADVPPQPQALGNPQPSAVYTVSLNRMQVYPPELGSGEHLVALTGLIANGWQSFDGYQIVDPEDRRYDRRGRIRCCSGDWRIVIDPIRRAKEFWQELEADGGYAATHVVRIVRCGASVFAAADVEPVLQAIRYALTLALGRSTDVLLPVGFDASGSATWSRWTAGEVDPYRPETTWLDKSCAARQIAKLLSGFVDCWDNELRRDTLLYASSYYRQSETLNHELGLAASVSGLLLVSVSWLAEELGMGDPAKWERREAEKQIRDLRSYCQVDPAVPTALARLQEVVDALNTGLTEAGKPLKDGLSALIALRNNVIHPTQEKRNTWTPYQWAEGHMLAQHYLELSLLAYISYDGQFHSRVSPNRNVGFTEPVPWLSGSAETGPGR